MNTLYLMHSSSLLSSWWVYDVGVWELDVCTPGRVTLLALPSFPYIQPPTSIILRAAYLISASPCNPKSLICQLPSMYTSPGSLYRSPPHSFLRPPTSILSSLQEDRFGLKPWKTFTIVVCIEWHVKIPDISYKVKISNNILRLFYLYYKSS